MFTYNKRDKTNAIIYHKQFDYYYLSYNFKYSYKQHSIIYKNQQQISTKSTQTLLHTLSEKSHKTIILCKCKREHA